MGLIAEEEKFIIEKDYEISFRPISDESFEKLPEETKNKINEMLILTQKEPEKAIPELLKLIKKFPDIPQINNFLFNAYIITNKMEKAESIAAENFKKHPGYLFARINYAYLKLQKHEYNKIPPIFNNKFNLKALYPKRKIFHISELAGFSDFLTMYYLGINKVNEAEAVYKKLRQIAPGHPLTKIIGRRILNEVNKPGK